MKKIVLSFILISLIIYSIAASTVSDFLSKYLGQDIEILWTRNSGFGTTTGKLIQVLDDGIVIEDGSKNVYFSNLYIVKIEVKK